MVIETEDKIGGSSSNYCRAFHLFRTNALEIGNDSVSSVHAGNNMADKAL